MCFIIYNTLRHPTLQVQTNLKLSEAAEFPFSKPLTTVCQSRDMGQSQTFPLGHSECCSGDFVPYPSTPVGKGSSHFVSPNLIFRGILKAVGCDR